jgi:hypothetical protein
VALVVTLLGAASLIAGVLAAAGLEPVVLVGGVLMPVSSETVALVAAVLPRTALGTAALAVALPAAVLAFPVGPLAAASRRGFLVGRLAHQRFALGQG